MAGSLKAFVVGFAVGGAVLSLIRADPAPSRLDRPPEVAVWVAEMGDVFANVGPVNPGRADDGDGVLAVRAVSGGAARTVFIPVRPRGRIATR